MNEKFENWKSTTLFAKETFFEDYIEYLQTLDLSKKPSEYVYLHELKRMRTTSLMSRLNNTCFSKGCCIDSLIINIRDVDIVVIYGLPYQYASISREWGSWTMTELKDTGCYCFEQINKDRISKRIHWDDKKWLNVWSVPLHLRAVTNGDKDFRKEYEGGYLVYEGNQYGDTSDFYIIGSLVCKE
jgi:hypothetical protein